MKRLIFIITIVLLGMQLKAQLIKDKWGNIISYPLTDGYKENPEVSEVPTFIIPKMDNDSLFRIYNNGKSIEELGNHCTAGFDLRCEPISLKENGKCIKLKHGKLWRYAIEGASAQGIGVDLGFPKLHKGSYIEIFPTDTTVELEQQREIFHSKNLLERHKKRGLVTLVHGKKLIIEYFEPDTLKVKDDIVIKRIFYRFFEIGNLKGSSYNNSKLKSGYYGSSQYPQCQKDVICSDIGNYQNNAKSVVFIYMAYLIDTNNDGYVEFGDEWGTGFFLNKVGGYASSDLPILVTAGHAYCIKISGSAVDLDGYISRIEARTNYQNAKCGTDDLNNRGRLLPGGFNRIALGSSWDDDGLSSYSPSNDYAILRASSDIFTFADYDLEYSAWSNNHDYYNSEGYFCIHHPKGDVKKINKDNDRAIEISSDGFKLKYDIGITENGSSGAPAFNSSRQIVGFHVKSDINKDCSLIGQMKSTNGKFDSLYNAFSYILDPTGAGSAQSSNPQPPSYSELPSHCSNCKQDYDETGIDCGGSCYPCGMQDVLIIKTDLDLLGSVKSRYEIFAEPDPGTLLALKSGSSSLEAGQNIYLNGGFEVQKGATFYAGIDAELMSEADRGCQPACVSQASLYLIPDGDGIYDYYFFRAAFITSYNIYVTPRNQSNNIVYSHKNVPVYSNGYIFAWDGTGAVSNGYYTIVIEATDCYGNITPYVHYIEYSLPKSGIIQDINEVTKSETETNHKPGIVIYPNPFNDEIMINYSGNSFPLECNLFDVNGKLIFKKIINNQHKKIDLKNVSSGTYIINAKAGEYNLVQKIIKE